MVGRRRRDLRAEERALWQDIVRSIKPLRRRAPDPAEGGAAVSDSDLQEMPSPDAVPLPKRSAASNKDPTPARADPPLAPLGRRFRQRIGRGAHTIDARLDLHGLTQAKAHAALTRFLRSAQADGAKLVLVITGKGGRAGAAEADRGVLRRQVPRWLAEPEFRAYVVGYEAAHIGHGGDGALYIRVRRRRAP
jgi:DNA-nicking Smr family endonuclease